MARIDSWVQGGGTELTSGSLTLLFFMSSTCHVCHEFFPLLERLHTELGSQGLNVVAAHSDIYGKPLGCAEVMPALRVAVWRGGYPSELAPAAGERWLAGCADSFRRAMRCGVAAPPSLGATLLHGVACGKAPYRTLLVARPWQAEDCERPDQDRRPHLPDC